MIDATIAIAAAIIHKMAIRTFTNVIMVLAFRFLIPPAVAAKDVAEHHGLTSK
jgi:hypothetical protein